MATIEERLKEVKEQLKKIESELKGVEQKPVSGWYKCMNDKFYLMYYDFEKDLSFGFNMGGEWVYFCCTDLYEDMDNLADPKEVEQRLIEEAKRRGFKEGVKFNCLFSGLPRKVNNLIYRIDHFHSYRVLDSDIGLIFNKGQWAEIIEEPLTLNGKEVVVDDLGIRIGIIHTYSDCLKTFLNHCSNLGIVEVESKIFGKVLTTEILELLTKIEERENR